MPTIRLARIKIYPKITEISAPRAKPTTAANCSSIAFDSTASSAARVSTYANNALINPIALSINPACPAGLYILAVARAMNQA